MSGCLEALWRSGDRGGGGSGRRGGCCGEDGGRGPTPLPACGGLEVLAHHLLKRLCDLADLGGVGVTLRGRGALWILELPDAQRVERIMARLLRGRVIASPTARFLRLMPPATITAEHLHEACAVVREACLATARAT